MTRLFTFFRIMVAAVLISGFSMTTLQAQSVVRYVTPTGSGTGASWADPSGDLQEMINLSGAGDQVWVAEGTYMPERTAVGYNAGTSSYPTADGTRDNAFVLKSGVSIYGGFPDSGDPVFEDRDWEAYPTILSGNIGSPTLASDNCHHVVIATNLTPIAATVIDGFTISDGNANGTGAITVNGVTVNRTYGGGMHNASSDPVLVNVNITENNASNGGGGMYNATSSPVLSEVNIIGNTTANNGGGMYNTTSSSPVLTNVTISGNTATNSGGGIFTNGTSSPEFTYVTISNNTAGTGGGMSTTNSSSILTNVFITENNAGGGGGGGMYNNNALPTLTNVIINGNSTTGVGGGMYNFTSSNPILTNVTISGNSANNGGGIANNGASSTLVNVTVSGNKATTNGGGMHNASSSPEVYNSILWGNISGGAATKTVYNTGPASVPEYSYSLIEGCGGSGSSSWTTFGTDNGNNIDADPKFIAPEPAATAPNPDGNYRIITPSPAIDAGYNQYYLDARGGIVDFTDETDLAGNPRLCDSNIDMGAYEFGIYPDANGIVYVDETQTGSGSSWTDAYPNLADPLILVAKQYSGAIPITISAIYVADGYYYPMYGADGFKFSTKNFPETDGGRDNAFVLVDGVELYGGFAVPFPAPATIPDYGDVGRDGTTVLAGDDDDCYHVVIGVNISENTVIDGFKIMSGNADGTGAVTVNGVTVNRTFGGGMYNLNSSPTLANIVFTANFASNGGGMANNNSSPTLANVEFSENTATTSGGGMYNTNTSSPTLTTVVFLGNTAANSGGGIFTNGNSSPEFTDVIIENNRANTGGGMSNNNSSPILVNVSITYNSSTTYGGGMFNNNASPTLTNVIFSANEANGIGGGVYNTTNSAPTFINTAIYGNSANNGGGIANNSSAPTLVNVTMSGNKATATGGGMYNASSLPEMYNTIIWGNISSGAATRTVYNSGPASVPVYSYSLIEGCGGSSSWVASFGTDNGNNIDADPLFVDPELASAAPTADGDYSLDDDSPAANVGKNSLYLTTRGILDFTDETDVAGDPRIVGCTIDLGAFEYQTDIPYTITATVGTGGSISPGGAGPFPVSCSGGLPIDQTFVITPNDCYQIDEFWIDDFPASLDSIVDGIGYYTFKSVMASHTLEVTFENTQYTIEVSTSTGGSISPADDIMVDCGSLQIIRFTPDPCYHVSQVLVDGTNNTLAAILGFYIFTNVQRDHEIAVTFAVNRYPIGVVAGPNGNITPGSGLVDCDGDTEFTITADNCYEIAQVLIDGTPLQEAVGETEYVYTFTNVTMPHAIIATFTKSQYTITATVDANGSISPGGAGPVPVSCGDSRTFTITPNDCYQIATFLIDDDPATPDSTIDGISYYTFANVTENHTIDVTFEKIQYTIEVSASTGGSISPADDVMVDCGSLQIIRFTPDPCYHVSQVLVDGTNNTLAAILGFYIFTNVQRDHEIAVTFAINRYPIGVVAGPNGSITPGSGLVDCGSEIEFTITADNCYEIAQVLVDGTPLQEAVGEAEYVYTFTNVTMPHVIIATFTKSQYTIEVSTTTGGDISPADDVTLDCGESQTYTFTPDDCYHVSRVMVDGNFNLLATWLGYYTFSNIQSNHTLDVTFAMNRYPIIAAAGPNGSIEDSGLIWVDCDDEITFYFAPDNCYEISQVLIDGVNDPDAVENGEYTFSDVRAAHAIIVLFTKIQYTITATASVGGSIDPEGEITVGCGDDLTFTFAPDPRYQIEGVYIDDRLDPSATSPYTFENITGNHTIYVNFEGIPVTSIEILNCPENGWMHLDETWQLEIEILPVDALNQNVIWASSNPSVATVDQTGFVTAKMVGATIITATTEDGGFVAECWIDVYNAITGITLNKTDLTLLIGDEETLKATILPEIGSIKDVIWESDDEGIATVDENGKVTGITVGGPVAITVTAVDGGLSATCMVTVISATYADPTGITIDPKTLTINRGESLQMEATIEPIGANPDVTWTSSAPTVASVDATGLLTALAAGKTTITVKTINNYSATCTVTVTVGIDTIIITPDECTIPLKGAKALKAAVYPADATNKTITWSSSDATIATVSATGAVTAKNINGTVEIYATNVASGKVGVCHVTVGSGKAIPVETETAGEIVVYPNPTTGKLRITNYELRITDVEILDILGRTCNVLRVAGNENEMDISNLPTGVYFLRIKTETGVVTRKVVKTD